MINETIPSYILGRFAPIIQANTATGYMLVLGFGLGLPAADYHPVLPKVGENLEAYEADKADLFWRFIYIFPVVINAWMLFSFFTFVKTDSILFCLRNGDEEQALQLIDKVYHADEDRNDILEQLKREVHKKEKVAEQQDNAVDSESYWDKPFGPKYRRGTITLMIFGSLCQQTSANVYMMFSNRIISELNEYIPKERQIAANLATQLIGTMGAIICCLSFTVVPRFGRQYLLARGFLLMTINLYCTVVSIVAKNGYATFFFFMTFQVFF